MNRRIITSTVVVAALATFGALCVLAYNCGDTWRTDRLDTFGASVALYRFLQRKLSLLNTTLLREEIS